MEELISAKEGARAGRRLTAAAALVCALTVVGSASVSSAHAATVPGNWWYDLYDIPEVHAEGWTGEGVKVAVVDSLINPDLPVFDGQNLTVADSLCADATAGSTSQITDHSVHGSTVTAVIIGNGAGGGEVRGIAPGAHLTFYGDAEGVFPGACAAAGDTGLTAFGLALKRAVADGTRIVSTSKVGTLSDEDWPVLVEALAKGVIVVAATGNGSFDASDPWSDNGVVAVSAVDTHADLQKSGDLPVALPETTVVAAGIDLPTVGDAAASSWEGSVSATGSSFAAPLVAGMLAVVAQKHPDATGNQLLQTLIHNTDLEARDPVHATDGYGYGAAWLTTMLKADPGQYPDENPLMDKHYAPTQEEVDAARDTLAGASPVEPPEAGAAPAHQLVATGMLSWIMPVAITVGVLVVGGALTTLLIVSTRRRRIGHGGRA